MPETKFKAKVLQVIDNVAETHETVVITKWGRPFVEVIHIRSPERRAVSGKLAHTLISEKDIVSPLGTPGSDGARQKCRVGAASPAATLERGDPTNMRQ